VIASIALSWLCSSATARADFGGDTPGVMVIGAEARAGSADAEVIAAVRDALSELDEVKLLPPSPLDLEAVQLAIDCGDESPQCLGEIAERMDAEIVIVPSLKPRRDALELHLTSFKLGANATTTALRKQVGTQLDATLLDTVPGMLREVLQLPARDEEERIAPIDTNEPTLAPEPVTGREAEPESASSSLPLGPVLLGGGGLALVAAGIVIGAMASSTEDDYASLQIDTEAHARRADDLRVRGQNEALAANILLGTGASALVAAGIWYVLDAQSEREPEAASVRPLLAPGSAGLVLTSMWRTP
jgi:hypothetical protein